MSTQCKSDTCSTENNKGGISAQRMLFFTVAILLGVGIWLSGWDKVHWIFYLPTVMLTFAASTGICPGLILFKKIGFK